LRLAERGATVTEIRLDVELAHPPERVWRAVVESDRLAEWFLPNDLRPVTGFRFHIEPAGEAGFVDPIDAEILELDPPRRLAMRWLAPELDARVSMTLVRVAGGCRLTLRQTGFFGMQGLLRRRVLHRAYMEMLGRRLPETLDRLAVEEGRRGPGGAVGAALARRRSQRVRAVDSGSRRNTARPFRRRTSLGRRRRAVGRVRVSRPLSLESTMAIAVAVLPGRRRAGHARRRRKQRPEWLRVLWSRLHRIRNRATDGLAALGSTVARRPEDTRARAVAVGAALLLALALILAIVAAATIMHPAADPQVGGGPDGPAGYAELPGRPPLSASPSESRSVSTAPGTLGGSAVPAAPGAAPLAAVYEQEAAHLGGYTGRVTLTNAGQIPLDGWTVVMTIPMAVSLPILGSNVRTLTGAVHRQDGDIVTFTPTNDTRLVGPGASVSFTFEVDGLAKPTACTVDGRRCSGIGE
jgi:uncharacterized protein YndB with AHSA1/START domain